MDDYIIKPCGKDEIDQVMLFFGEHWNKNHVVAANKSFMDWQFYNKNNGNYNIIIAKDKANNNIIGMYAYVSNFHFDSEIQGDDKFIWFTNWLVDENYRNKGIGKMLYDGLVLHEKTDNIGSAGTNESTARIFGKMNYKSGKYNHYFLVNNQKTPELKIILNYQKQNISYEKSEKSLQELHEISEFQGRNEIFPLKTNVFINNKYVNNPYYKYFLYGIKEKNKTLGVIVFKIVRYNGVNIIRIVDFIGRLQCLSGLYEQLQALLKQFDAEYLDFYCYGIGDEILKSSGFEKNDGQNGLIVPNYFEPFLPENIVTEFVYNAKFHNKIQFFKGDGDRDNPRK